MGNEKKFAINDTCIGVWVDQSISHPTLTRLFEMMEGRGFEIGSDSRIDKHYPILSKTHFAGSKGTLQFTAEKYPAGFRLEFYQELNFKNPNGGKYDFNKYKMMPYLIRKQFDLESRHIREFLIAEGYLDETEPTLKTSIDKVMHKINDPKRHWSSDDNRIADYNAKDKDGLRMKNGETKYFRDRKGVLQRCTVYHNINNMWWAILNKDNYTNLGSYQFFSLDTVEENKLHKLVKHSGHHNPKSRYVPSENELSAFSKTAKDLKREVRINSINEILCYLYENNWLSRKFEFFSKQNSRLGLKEPEGKPFGMYRKHEEPVIISLDKKHLPMSSTESGWIRSLEKYVRNGKQSVGDWFCTDKNGEGSKAYIWPEVRLKLLQIGAMK